MSTPDYVVDENVVFTNFNGDTLTLPAGSFVKPIDFYYIPAHIKITFDWRVFNKDTHIFCYTRFGIIPIEKKKIRRT